MQIGVGYAVFAEDFDAIVHAPSARPTVFDETNGTVREFEDAERIVLGFGLVGVNVGAHLAVNGFNGRAAEKKIAEGDAVAAEVHERAAAGAIDVPKPGAVRAKMLFTLFDEINFSERAGVRHFLGLQIFWREEKLFAVHQQDAVLPRGGNHLFAFGDSHGERFFTDNVLACGSDVFCHLRVETVGRGDGDHFDVALFEHFAVIGEDARDAESLGQRRGVAGGGGGDGDDFRLVRHDLERRSVNIRLELRSDDADFYSAFRHGVSDEMV